MRALLAFYARLLDPPPAGLACFDRDGTLVYPSNAGAAVDALADTARMVMATADASTAVVLPGSELVASPIVLRSAEDTIGIVFVLSNPRHDAESRELVMFADAPVAVFDTSDDLVFANAAWLRDVPGGELDAAARAIFERVRRGEIVEVSEVNFGGGAMTGLAGAMVSALGTYAGSIVVGAPRTVDATHHARLADAELANRQKDVFIASVAHELRAPLATMLLWEKVLRDAWADTEMRSRAIAAIHSSATAQARLVGDLLDVTRVLAGKLQIASGLVEIGAVIATVAAQLQPLADERAVTLRCELATHHRHVRGDAARLRQVFANLVVNALQASSASQTVTIRSAEREGAVAIRIEDAGRGISAAELPHLFEPFHQGHDGGGGLGLGLTIAKQLVTLHGGSLTAASAGPGRGATFTVELPVAPAEET